MYLLGKGDGSKMVTNEEIEEKMDAILKHRFQCNAEKMEFIKEKKTRLLSSEIGFSAANLFELFLEIENAFGISFSEEELLSFEFDKYKELSEIIKRKVGKKC